MKGRRAKGSLSLGAVLGESTRVAFRHLPALLVLAALAHGPWVAYYLDRMHAWWAYAQDDAWGFDGSRALAAGWMSLIYGPVLAGFLLQTAAVQGVHLALLGTRYPFVKGLARLRRLPIALLVAVLVILAIGAVATGVTLAIRILFEIAGPAAAAALLIAYLLCLGLVARWFVAIQASIAEKGGPLRALGRSAFLTRGSRWRLFALLLVLFVLGLVGIWLAATLVPTGEEGRPWSGEVWRYLLVAVSPVLVSTVHAVAAAVVYHRLRRAKEGIEVGEATQVFE